MGVTDLGRCRFLVFSVAFQFGINALAELVELGDFLRARDLRVMADDRAIGQGQAIDDIGLAGIGRGGFHFWHDLFRCLQHVGRGHRAQAVSDAGLGIGYRGGDVRPGDCGQSPEGEP